MTNEDIETNEVPAPRKYDLKKIGVGVALGVTAIGAILLFTNKSDDADENSESEPEKA